MASQYKQVYFNIESEKDLLDFANSLTSFSAWVKDHLKEAINAKTEPNKQPKSEVINGRI